ncbi:MULTISPECIES: acylphosphatase [Atopobiaceae]|uniref:acylphosphatase n=1 Tax=Atopobiaceae TaxID=1643824 RepID=UPI00034E40CA|nr:MULTISPECIES: acylphosphatase [Atopobiaceae]EPD78666.1 acylphosphatase [Atopobium sp. oral taxon 199 str. F0494]
MSGILGFGQRKDRDKGPHGDADKQLGNQGLKPGTRRLALRFCGEVQGVGFRWTAQIVADRVGCTGWVRNEFDGSVSMELQGTDEQIGLWFKGFAKTYAHRPLAYRIDEKRELAPIADERHFEVRF